VSVRGNAGERVRLLHAALSLPVCVSGEAQKKVQSSAFSLLTSSLPIIREAIGRSAQHQSGVFAVDRSSDDPNVTGIREGCSNLAIHP
jgi:hypothetical protein